MKLIYVHHAERDFSNLNDDLRQFDDITLDGIKDAELLSSKIDKLNVTKIISSPYKRCKHTAEILNKNLNVDIIYEDRFNEFKKGETKEEFLKRNIDAIEDIINECNDSDNIICVTSGVNLTAFICHYYKINYDNSTSLVQAFGISPVIFEYKK